MSPITRLFLLVVIAFASLAVTAPAHAEEQPPRDIPIWITVAHPITDADGKLLPSSEWPHIVDSAIVPERSGYTPYNGVGWWKDNASPTVDQFGYHYTTAHKTPGKDIEAPYRNLHLVAVGDVVWLTFISGVDVTKVAEFKVTNTVALPNAQAHAQVLSDFGYGVLAMVGCEGTKIWESPSGERRQTDVRPGPNWKLVDRAEKRIVKTEFVKFV